MRFLVPSHFGQAYALLVDTNPDLTFSLKVTNFYRKSFGDDLLPMVAHGTNGNQWLPMVTVGCDRIPSVGITFYRW